MSPVISRPLSAEVSRDLCVCEYAVCVSVLSIFEFRLLDFLETTVVGVCVCVGACVLVEFDVLHCKELALEVPVCVCVCVCVCMGVI